MAKVINFEEAVEAMKERKKKADRQARIDRIVAYSKTLKWGDDNDG